MARLLEVYERARTGPSMDEESFDLDVVYETARTLCEKYGVAYDPEIPVPSNDDLADRVFQAAIDFLSETGVYCLDTQRVIPIEREEILHALATSRGRCVMGEGKDRAVFTSRKPDSDIKPWFHVGTGIMNTDERIAFNLARAYGSVRQADSVSVPALENIEGQKIIAGTPTEIYGAIRGIQIARDALRQAGRPGLPIGNLISTAGSAVGTIAASAPQFGLRPSDGWLVASLAEMKINMDSLNQVAYLTNWGANLACEHGPLVGGYAGGPAGTAILMVAYILLGLVIMNCNYHISFPIHITRACSTGREVLWAVAVSAQAISRNTREPIWYLGYASAGPMTKQFFYECAAYVAATMSSGVSPQTVHPARAIYSDYITPMEMVGSVQITEACVGMTRVEANELVKELLRKYEDNIDEAPQGKKYQECHDIETGKPSQEYVDLYREVKEELRSMGIDFKS